MEVFPILNKCRNEKCGWGPLVPILDLGMQPWCNDFLTEDQLGDEKTYPLMLLRCSKCTLLQISHTVPKEIMFGNHDYLSGSSQALKEHFKEVAEKVTAFANLSIDDLIVDIGGNDGSQLQQFQSLGRHNVLNIESSKKTAELATKNEVRTDNKYFNEEYCINHPTLSRGRAKVINAAGVFFHLEELTSVIKGIQYLLADNGTLVIQFGYAGQVIEHGFYDFIYHEHLCIYTLTSLCNLLEPYGLYPKCVYEASVHNGSLVVFFGKTKDTSLGDQFVIDHFLETEKRICSTDACLDMTRRIVRDRPKLRNLLERLYREGKKVWGYGAPAKGNTLLNYCGVQYPLIQKTVEVNPFKINKFLPGSHIPIVDENGPFTFRHPPDYMLMLSHNLKDDILKKYEGTGTKFIVPLPDIEVIEA